MTVNLAGASKPHRRQFAVLLEWHPNPLGSIPSGKVSRALADLRVYLIVGPSEHFSSEQCSVASATPFNTIQISYLGRQNGDGEVVMIISQGKGMLHIGLKCHTKRVPSAQPASSRPPELAPELARPRQTVSVDPAVHKGSQPHLTNSVNLSVGLRVPYLGPQLPHEAHNNVYYLLCHFAVFFFAML
jgi:hypothetical protein